MKKTKLIFTIAAAFLMVSAPWFFTSCDNSDDSTNESAKSDTVAEEDLNAETENLDDAAFRVLRELCALPTDADPIAGETSGIELLPEGWQGMKFQPDEGYVLNDEQPTVRSVVVAGLDDAKEYVSSIIGEDIEGDSFSWSDSALGSLRFKAGSGEDIFATLDVSISQIDNLTQIQFVSSSYFEDSPNSENAFKGVPYYAAGDVVLRKSDKTYWICVRPAGGPYHKDNSYWICLHPYTDKGKCLLTSVKKTYDNLAYGLEDFTRDGGMDDLIKAKRTWTFASGLMSLKIAKAAAHTFSIIGYDRSYDLFPDAKNAYDAQIAHNVDIRNLTREAIEPHPQIVDSYGFNFAYGSYKPDGARSKSHKTANIPKKAIKKGYKKYYEKYAHVNLVQPFLTTAARLKDGHLTLDMRTSRDIEIGAESTENKIVTCKFLFSATDSFDDGFLWTEGVPFPPVEVYELGDRWSYDFNNFMHFHTVGGPLFKYYDDEKNPEAFWEMTRFHIIFSPQISIPDNKGKNGQAVKPDDGYTDIVRQNFDYWASLEKVTRIVDGKTITDWKKESE